MAGKTLVTGGTGLIGWNLIRQLLEKGRKVRALVRSMEKALKLLPPEVEMVPGDVRDRESLLLASRDCDVMYHAAGFPEQWMKDPAIFRQINVEGTRNALFAAKQNRIRRFVYTSTIDIFLAGKGETYTEDFIDPKPKGTYYERSKQEADRLAVQALDEGMDIVFLHPSGVYGPGPTDSPGTNQFIADLARGKVPMLLPGGFPVVFAGDAAAGHILAEEKAKCGSRFILSENYYSLSESARIIASELGLKKIPPVMPLWTAKIVSILTEGFARLTGIPPLLPAGQLHFLQWEARPDAKKARLELGWESVDFSAGVAKTIEFLKSAGKI